MFASNPFAPVMDSLSPLAMNVYLILMIVAVFIGTLFDISHQGSARFFARRREQSRAAAQR